MRKSPLNAYDSCTISVRWKHLLSRDSGLHPGQSGLQVLQPCFQDLHLAFQLLLALSTLSKKIDEIVLSMLGGRHYLQGGPRCRTPR